MGISAIYKSLSEHTVFLVILSSLFWHPGPLISEPLPPNPFTALECNILQIELKHLGYYNSDIDSLWGSQTYRALKCYFKDFNLALDLRNDGALKILQSHQHPKPPKNSLRAVCLEKKMKYPPKELHILVDKKNYRTHLYSGEVKLKSYKNALGGAPVGHKLRRGDSKTPEGEYYVCFKKYDSQFHLNLCLSYPNCEDATSGLVRGIITKAQKLEICRQIAADVQPLWGTALGGNVGLHGGGAWTNWTLGCIAHSNYDIEEMFAICPVGTAVKIVASREQ